MFILYRVFIETWGKSSITRRIKNLEITKISIAISDIGNIHAVNNVRFIYRSLMLSNENLYVISLILRWEKSFFAFLMRQFWLYDWHDLFISLSSSLWNFPISHFEPWQIAQSQLIPYQLPMNYNGTAS